MSSLFVRRATGLAKSLNSKPVTRSILNPQGRNHVLPTRRFSSEPLTANQQNNGNEENHQHTKEIKRQLISEPPALMGLWKVLGITGFAAATFYYLNDADHRETRVNRVMRLIMNPDPEVKKEGLRLLRDCFYTQTKLTSGVVEIPHSASSLIQEGIIESLLENLNTTDAEVTEKVLSWLIRFSEEPEGRKRILANGLPLVLDAVAKSESASKVWFTGSTLLLKLGSYEDSIPRLTSPRMIDYANQMYASGHPLAQLLAAKLLLQLSQHDQKLLLNSQVTQEQVSSLTTPASAAALNAAIYSTVGLHRPVVPFDSVLSTKSLLHLNWTLMFAVFGSLWGRARWAIRAKSMGLSGPQLWKFVGRKSRVGSFVFFLLSLDWFAELLMAWPEQGVRMPFVDHPVKIPERVLDKPLTTVVPIGEAAVFAATAVYGIYSQRYLVLPLALAGTSAYWKEIQSLVKPYEAQLGFKLSDVDVSKPIFRFGQGDQNNKK